MLRNIRKKEWFIFIEGCLYRFPLHLHLRSFISFYTVIRFIDVFLILPAIFYYLVWSKRKKYNCNNHIEAVFIVKNEGEYLNELISYYLTIGFDRLIFYDNMSTDNTYQVIHKYMKSSKISYHKIHGSSRQKDIYNIAFNKYGSEFKYMAFFDADEFLRVKSFSVFLEVEKIFKDFEYNNIGSIAVPWILYGSSGFVRKPDGFMINNYKMRLPFGIIQHVKPIIKTSLFFYQRNPHVPSLKKGYNYVSPSGKTCKCSTTILYENEPLYLNHYYFKSVEEFSKKITRGSAYGTKEQRELEWLYDTDKLCIEDDFDSEKYISKMEDIISHYSN